MNKRRSFCNAELYDDVEVTEFLTNFNSPIASLILQLLSILLFSRVCAWILRFAGQPQVVGEMIAGILLGRSVFAQIWPDGFEWLFPESAMPRLFFLSQIGLIFFMFVVGLDLNLSDMKKRGGSAIFISHVSIVVPFALGIFGAWLIFDDYGPAKFDFLSFALFMGIAMSITAFPVLARILQERKLTQTPLGALALSCAAIDDVTAWCILAAVIGIVKAGSMVTAAYTIGAALVFVALMFFVVRPFVAKVLKIRGDLTSQQLAFLFCILLGSALISEVIGIHALFGSFLAGVIMPQDMSFRSTLIEKIEDLTSVVLLPIFFAYTGLRTQIGLLDSPEAWLVCLGITALAVVGKFGGSAAAARITGLKWRDACALGALMNTRGLMELIVLNIGYDLGILSPKLFSVMIVMAIVTTLMTTPLLSLFKVRSTPS